MEDEFLPFAQPDIGESEIREVSKTLQSGWITTGQKTREFERAFAETVGAKHAVAVNSCTAAMHLALEAIGIEQGDEVITTPYTFAATAEVIRYFDARPVFVDINPDTLNIEVAKIEAAVTERTRAIIPVHIAGRPAEMGQIVNIARRNGLRVIEDAAHAFPARHRNDTIGSIGDFTCFSFYATKTLTTGEGGMICTDNDDWADRCRIMALHGISKDAWNRYSEEGSWYYEVTAPGYKYNMTDLAAAMGLVQLEKADQMWRRRQEIAMRYTTVFQDVEELVVPVDYKDGQHAWHLYMLRLNEARLAISRSTFINELQERTIGTSVHFIPLHIHPYYQDTYGFKADDYPIAHQQYKREISLPIYSKMSDADIERVIEAVLDVVGTHRVSAAVTP